MGCNLRLEVDWSNNLSIVLIREMGYLPSWMASKYSYCIYAIGTRVGVFFHSWSDYFPKRTSSVWKMVIGFMENPWGVFEGQPVDQDLGSPPHLWMKEIMVQIGG